MTLGYQGSETTRAEAIIYQHGDDPILVKPEDSYLPIRGRSAMDIFPSLRSVSTNKSLSGASGDFSLEIKASKEGEPLFQRIADDDWVDIIYYRHNQPWHVMRGLIDTIQRSRVVGGSGATVETYTISGRDFGKIWEMTPVWFSPYANDMATDIFAKVLFSLMTQVQGPPNKSVRSFLEGFLAGVGSQKGPDWAPPEAMPGILKGTFLENVKFADSGYTNIPPRKIFNVCNFTEGMLWQLAEQYSDRLFVELFCDLCIEGDPESQCIARMDPVKPGDAMMTVVIRDRPFPVVDPKITDYKDRWKKIPISMLPSEQIVSIDVSRGGMERFNAYFCAPIYLQEAAPAYAINILPPLYDELDIKRHGLRRMDVQAITQPDDFDMGTMAEQQRRILRDFYALNPYFLSGSISLGMGRPDVKIGTRIQIPTYADRLPETYYVEAVSHRWMFGAGMRTTLGVTRGWLGTDDSQLKALKTVSDRFVVPKYPS